MEITTKYDLGDTVWHVFDKYELIVERCKLCVGAGKLAAVGVDELVNCPRCHGYGTEHGDKRIVVPTVQGPYTIGQVRVEIRESPGRPGYQYLPTDQHNVGPQSYQREEAYMAVETGVGSGTVYHVENMYVTEEEARAEADRRNARSVEIAELAG